MHLFSRYPAATLVMLFFGTVIVMFTTQPQPGFMVDAVEFDVASVKPYHESVRKLEYFYLQRSYGNPGVNVDQNLWREYNRVAKSPQSALYKPFAPSNTWVSEGPSNIGGRMRAVAVHPTETNTLYAGGASGGVWKSTDLGVTWMPLSDNQPRLAVGALAIDKNDPNIVFAGTGEPILGTFGRGHGSPFYDGVGILRTDNAGADWELLPWPSATSAVHRIALHPESSDTLLVATIDRLAKSTDGGRNWGTVLNGIITDVLYHPTNPSTVYAAIGSDHGGSPNGVYVSHSGGNRYTWEKLDANFAPGDSCGRIVLAMTPADPERIYAAVAMNRRHLTSPDADFKGLWVSTNGGEYWERKPTAISGTFTRGQAFYDLCIAASPVHADVVFLGGIDMYRSTNGGNGFSKRSRWELRVTDPNNPEYVHADQHHIMFKPDDPNTIIVGNDGGVFISFDGGNSWEERSNTLETTQFYGIAYAPSNPRLLYGGTQDNSNMRLQSIGMTEWLFVGGGDGGNIAVDHNNHNLMYLCMNSTPYRTFDGLQFYPLHSGLEGQRFNWIRPMVLSANGQRLYTASNRVHLLSPAPDAHQWTTISGVLPTGSGIITDLEVLPNDPRWIFASTSTGQVYYSDNLTAYDPDWFNISAGLPNRWISDIHVAWNDYRTIYAAISGYGTGHAFMSTNLGETWVDISGDLPDIPANAIIPSRTEENTVFLATDLGVWYTTDGGEHWKQFGNGLPNVVCYDMKLTPLNTLIVGSYGRGVWSTDVTTTVVRASAVAPVAPVSLIVAPNPVIAEHALLEFTLKTASAVSIRIYDAAGRLVSSAVDARYDAGRHVAPFSASTLGSGTYFAVLEAGNERTTTKIALVR